MSSQDDALVSIGKKASKPRQEWTLDTFVCIFVQRHSCGTESKAFERSKKITSVDKPLSESLAEGILGDSGAVSRNGRKGATKACLFQFKMMLHFCRSYNQALLYLQLRLSFPSTPTLAKKKAFRTLLTQWILPHFRMLKYRGSVNLTFVKELFWKEPFFRVSYTKMLIFGREKLSGYKYI